MVANDRIHAAVLPLVIHLLELHHGLILVVLSVVRHNSPKKHVSSHLHERRARATYSTITRFVHLTHHKQFMPLGPISLEIMRDPVVAADGHHYDRHAIETWLKNNNTSPQTNEALEHKFLARSHTLRNQIQEWKGKNQIN